MNKPAVNNQEVATRKLTREIADGAQTWSKTEVLDKHREGQEVKNNHRSKVMNNKNFQPNKAESTKPLSQRAGETIERAGQKITSAGSEKIGQAVRDAGNKVEQLGSKKRQ